MMNPFQSLENGTKPQQNQANIILTLKISVPPWGRRGDLKKQKSALSGFFQTPRSGDFYFLNWKNKRRPKPPFIITLNSLERSHA
jgi:hypothetical protein